MTETTLTLTEADLCDRSRVFLTLNHKPLEMTPDQRERFYRDYGLMIDFISELYAHTKLECTPSANS